MYTNYPNFNKILNDKFEINKTKDDMKNIINAVEAFDFMVKKITIKMGIKISTNELLNVYLLLNAKLRANNNIKLNLASSDG